MTAVDDQAVRERALSPGESFIVQAPAGSGKTELLIQRYLMLLARVSQPEEIVAITFTRKAAAEMRERVLDTLRRADANETGQSPIEAERLALARDAMANDHRHGWQVTQHPSRLRIQTIDSLCLSLARQLPVLSGLVAPMGLVDDPGAAYRRAARQALRLLGGANPAWNRALEAFLLHLDNDVGRGVELIAAMLASRDQWLRHLGADAIAPERLEAAWRQVIESRLCHASELFSAALSESLTACADAAAGHLAAADDPPPGAAAWLQGEGFPAPRVAELARWRFLAELLLVQSGPHWRKQVNKNQGFPPHSDAKRAMGELLSALAGDEALAHALFAIRSLPEPGFEPDKQELLNAMLIVLKLAVARLQVDFEASARVDFVEVTQRAIHALGALEDPSDLAMKLDYRIQHLLVDEFQDTAMAQYHLLRLLTQGWAPDDGRTLFLVGDPMQSIYRFREAEVGIFLSIRERGLDTVPLQPLRLRSNFRSAPAVVDWINRTFEACFPRASDWQTGAVAYAGSSARRAEPDSGAGVHVHPCLDCSEAEQADRLARLVEEAMGGSRDVAVLVRARSHLRHIMPALRARGIPYTGMDVTALVNVTSVRDLYSLTRALLHPADRMAWLSLLRAPWCGLMLEDLLVVAASGRGQIWEALHDPQVQQRLTADGRRRVARITHGLAGAMQQRGRLTLRQWVRRAWLSLDGPALIDSAGLEHVQAYLSLLGRHQTGMHLADEQAFQEALHGHWAHAQAPPGAVRLMTIHRAKGLEFDEVFLPGLARASRADDKPLLLWEEPVDGDGLLLATLSARGAADDLHYRYLRGLQSSKASHETDRLLYVACTRARDRLHLLGNLDTAHGEVKPPAQGSLLKRIWPSVEDEFVAHAGSRPGLERNTPGGTAWPEGGQALHRLPSSWQAPGLPPPLRAAALPPVDERQVEFQWAGETARLVGVLVHEVLQQVAGEGIEQWSVDRIEALAPCWRRRLEHAGVALRELEAATARTVTAMGNVLNDDKARWLLRAGHRDAANEYELRARAAGRIRRLRIDRTFVDEHGTRWIIDYKTSAHGGGDRQAFLDEEARRYAGQMAVYGDAFHKLGGAEIRLALYFPLLAGWREWAYKLV